MALKGLYTYFKVTLDQKNLIRLQSTYINYNLIRVPITQINNIIKSSAFRPTSVLSHFYKKVCQEYICRVPANVFLAKNLAGKSLPRMHLPGSGKCILGKEFVRKKFSLEKFSAENLQGNDSTTVI